MVMLLNIYILCLPILKTTQIIHADLQLIKKLFVPRRHHKSFSYTAVIIWNALPKNMKSSETFTRLKKLYIKKTLEEN